MEFEFVELEEDVDLEDFLTFDESCPLRPLPLQKQQQKLKFLMREEEEDVVFVPAVDDVVVVVVVVDDVLLFLFELWYCVVCVDAGPVAVADAKGLFFGPLLMVLLMLMLCDEQWGHE